MLWRDLKAWQIWGANTDVGKTIISTVLCKALTKRVPSRDILYLKPVQTGPDDGADRLRIKDHVEGITSPLEHLHYKAPKSPHVAAQEQPLRGQHDLDIVNYLRNAFREAVKSEQRYAFLETAGGVLSPSPIGTLQADTYRPLRLPAILVGDSKLGGIGATISAYESLSMRGYDVDSLILFDDPKWENFEFLKQHFADKHGILTYSLPLPPPKVEDSQEDADALRSYINECSESTTMVNMISTLNHKHFSRISALGSMPAKADSIIWHPFRQHTLPQSIIAIDSAHNDVFTAYNQETDSTVSEITRSKKQGINQIDMATQRPMTTDMFDASASWWTQGLGHGNPDLALTAAHAAGRYGHVMFANGVHQPALDLCYNLLETLGNPRLSRVFFTDNGSTGMEVAVKMALRASCQRYGWDKEDVSNAVGILGLKGSYHGDTIGVMNCSEPNTFNEKVDWYQPWGFWFDPPSVSMKQGKWEVDIPSSISELDPSQGQDKLTFDSLESIFDFSSRPQDEQLYKSHITRTLKHLTHTQSRRFGALIMEPLLMGAGGMIFVDPLFQRTLINTIRSDPTLINPSDTPQSSSSDPGDWTGLPLIADEVFTGLYRLGRASSSSFLSPSNNLPMDIAPDISVHAKLLTGGLLPLALTTASNSIFNTFLSPSKADALLHGHSYTAHPIGCAVANHSLKEMKRLHEKDEGWAHHRALWTTNIGTSPTPTTTTLTTGPSIPSTNHPKISSFFSPTFLTTLSHHPLISSCFALGTVLVMTLNPPPGGAKGYTSSAATSLQSRLLNTTSTPSVTPPSAPIPTHTPSTPPTTSTSTSTSPAPGTQTLSQLEAPPFDTSIHARTLGDVLYIMTSLTTKPQDVRVLEGKIMQGLAEEVVGR
jgi:bifunctional dethiobiotin synthetase / adenosylmethionine---8-amino-7-oxononanoate aminotransferase